MRKFEMAQPGKETHLLMCIRVALVGQYGRHLFWMWR